MPDQTPTTTVQRKGGPREPLRLGFGKYRGSPLVEVPTSYLVWLIGTPDLLPGLRQAVMEELQARRMEKGSVSESRDLMADLKRAGVT